MIPIVSHNLYCNGFGWTDWQPEQWSGEYDDYLGGQISEG